MAKYKIVVIERSETSFEVDAKNENHARKLISEFYNGFSHQSNYSKVKNLGVEFLDWDLWDIIKCK